MQTKVEKYRRIRGLILKLLAHEHPGAIDMKVIHALLDDLQYTIKDEEMQSHLVYLEKKGFILKLKRESGGVQIEMAVINPAGLDLLDGLTKDVGVDVRF
jgi:hypothetical protein